MDSKTIIYTNDGKILLSLKECKNCNTIIATFNDKIQFLIKEYPSSLSNKNNVIYYNNNINLEKYIETTFTEDKNNLNNICAKIVLQNDLCDIFNEIKTKYVKKLIDFIESDIEKRRILIIIFNNSYKEVSTSIGNIGINDKNGKVMISLNGIPVITIGGNVINQNIEFNDIDFNEYGIEKLDQNTINDILKDIEY